MHESFLFLKTGLLLCLLLVAACSTAQNSAARQGATPFLHFQKTPCLGTCPFYEALISENGSIRYIGREHVPVQDTVYFQLTDAELSQLREDVAKLDYKGLQDLYLTNWSDMPSTIITFYEAGKEVKRVQQEEGGPQPLLDLQEKLHAMLMRLAEEEARKRLPIK
jgi:hypothetical protein